MAKQAVVLDIDDTLADTARYITQRMVTEYGCEESQDADYLVSRYLQPGLMPCWQTLSAQHRIGHFFQDVSVLASIPPVLGAQKGVAALTGYFDVKLYLSSRLNHLEDLTKKWLKRHGFPSAPLVLRRPEERLPTWKILYLNQEFVQPVILIDNEVGLLDLESQPCASTLVWFNQYHRPSRFNHPNLISVSSWSELIESIVKK